MSVYGIDYDEFGNAMPGEDVYDPEKPLALLEKAAATEPGAKRDEDAVRAVQRMLAAGADAGVLTRARKYAKREGLLSNGEFDAITRDARPNGDGDDSGHGPSVATQLVELAQEMYSFGVSTLDEPFAIPVEGPKVVAMLRGGKSSLRALMSREYFTRNGKVPAQQALTDALNVLEGFAQTEDPQRLYLRCAELDGTLWLDLGDVSGRAVRVTADGWEVVDEPPVLFRRTVLTGALPEPARGGELDDLWNWVNVSNPDRPMVAAELVGRLFSDQPHVVVDIRGEHGTAKTTTTKVLVALTDPGPALTRKPPRDMDGWVTAAAGSWVVALDNLSDIPPWLSDSICRASTGEGDVRRTLFKDRDLTVFSFLRCVMFNGIDVGALAPDLADRAVPIALEAIPAARRKNEKAFWREWGEAHPKLLGAVLTLASQVLNRLPRISPAELPRMADYALILAVVDDVLATDGLRRYSLLSTMLAADSLSGHGFAVRLQEVLTEPFEGTSAQLRKRITPEDQPKDWPKDARAVTTLMRKLAPAFRKTGWAVHEIPPGHDNVIRWKVSPPQQEPSRGKPRTSSQASHEPSGARDARDCEASRKPSREGSKEKRPCPRHDTPFGYRKGCQACEEANQ